MNPNALIPTADALPVASWWFEGLGILTLAIHLVMVNVLVGGSLIALYVALTDRQNPVVKSVSDKLPTIFALTVNFGVAPLLFLQVVHGQFFYTSATMSAVWWLGIVLLLIGGYYAMYVNQYRQGKSPMKAPLFLAAGLVMVLCISVVLTSVMTTVENPELWIKYFTNANGTVLNLFETTTVPRYLHFLLACLAIGGLFVALLASYGRLDDKAGTMGIKVFTTTTLLQMATGLWWLMALERPVLLQFMGDNPLATALLLVAVGLTFPALIAGFSNKPRSAAVWTGLTVLAMVGLRATVRALTLKPYFSSANLPVTGEYTPLVLFLVTLAAGLILVGYMLKLALKPQREG
ncbi:hypothetical protein JCM12178A_17130 [Salidesulfovibrio brasiliensis]